MMLNVLQDKSQSEAMKDVAIYTRTSCRKQNPDSLQQQEQACRHYAEKYGYQVVKVYQDPAKSGTNSDRDGFHQMMADAKEGCFQAILLFDISRLTRNYRDGVMLLLLLYQYGVQIIPVAAPPIKDFTSPLLLADYESDLIGQKTRTGLEAAAAKGRHTGGKPPFGYRLDENKQLVIVPEEEKIVKEIFNLYLSGLSMEQVASKINKMGKASRAGRNFTRFSVRDILDNEKYTGNYVYHPSAGHAGLDGNSKITVPGGCPAIITAADFEAAKRRRKGSRDGK